MQRTINDENWENLKGGYQKKMVKMSDQIRKEVRILWCLISGSDHDLCRFSQRISRSWVMTDMSEAINQKICSERVLDAQL